MVARNVRDVTITCDKCGAIYAEADRCVNEIIVAMDQDECVSYVHRRDYCGDCSGAIWEAICAVISVNPDEEGRTGFDDD
jgi:hypothetical protein